VAELLPGLSDASPNVRYYSAMALRSTFNQEFGYHYNNSQAGRDRSIELWRAYLESLAAEAAEKKAKEAQSTENGTSNAADDEDQKLLSRTNAE